MPVPWIRSCDVQVAWFHPGWKSNPERYSNCVTPQIAAYRGSIGGLCVLRQKSDFHLFSILLFFFWAINVATLCGLR